MNLLNKLNKFIISVLYVVAFGLITYIRFSNPELTETQLFLNYWYVWFGIIALVVCTNIVGYITNKVGR